jgi:hypothetical protein
MRASFGPGDAGSAPFIETGCSKLCGEDHQREEQDQGGAVDGCAEIANRHRFARKQRNQGDERDADSIELQPWNATKCHADICQGEYDGDERWHLAGPLHGACVRDRF